MTFNIAGLRGKHLLVLNWRDVQHSQAGGAEFYMHEIARRWVAAGIKITWLTAREPAALCYQVVDGIDIRRAGGPLSVYVRAALRLPRGCGQFDAVIDCQNGIPFFAPLFTPRRFPVVQVFHHVHQDQFATRFSRVVASLGRFLEGPVSRWVYSGHSLAAVSTSTRQELRSRLKVRTPIFVVPNGAATVPDMDTVRSDEPTIVVVNRLVAHKRIDFLLNQLRVVAREIPRLRVHIVGDGPELLRLRHQLVALDLQETATFHGYQPDHVRDALLRQAWLTVSVSAAEGWGRSVIDAAAWGVPCLGRKVAGIRESVVHDRTGWLIEADSELAPALIHTLHQLRDHDYAAQLAQQCRRWAACFDWGRSAELLAGVVSHEIQVQRLRQLGITQRRAARSDIATVVSFPSATGRLTRSAIRATDEVSYRDGMAHLLLTGCDEVGAQGVLARLGVEEARIRLASRHDLLVGPAAPAAESAPASGER